MTTEHISARVVPSPLVATDLPEPNTRPLDAALAYLALGFQVVQLCQLTPDGGCTCPAGKHTSRKAGKVPRRTGWERMGTTDKEARSWWRGAEWENSNVGLVMGGARRLVALDVDGPEGKASLAALEERHGPLPLTLTNGTTRGDHRVFEVPGEWPLDAITNTAGDLAPGLDVRTEGGQIAVAPSVHLCGHRYHWTVVRDPAALPRWLYDLMTAGQGGRGSSPSRPAATSADRARARLDATLPKLCDEVRTAPATTRNRTLNNTSLRAFRLAAAAGADLDAVARDLDAAGEGAGLGPGERAATIASARKAAKAVGAAPLPERPAPVKARHAPTAKALTLVNDAPRNGPKREPGSAGQGGESEGGGERPTIAVGPDLHRMVDEAEGAIGSHPAVYQRARMGLVRIAVAPAPGKDLSERAANLTLSLIHI